MQDSCAKLVNELANLLESPSFAPLAVGVVCNRENRIVVTHSADDVEKSLFILLDKVKNNLHKKIWL